MNLFKKGDVVTVFQMHPAKGLLVEGKATIMKPLSRSDEHYMVRFHGRDGKPSLGEEYERFIDRDGQTDPEAYIKAFNKKIGYA
jgi:hypothetical protein